MEDLEKKMAQRNSFWKTGGFDILAKVPVHMKSKKKGILDARTKTISPKNELPLEGIFANFQRFFFRSW